MDEENIGPTEIASWLDSQSDFTLEMNVFSHTASLGFDVEHGGTYTDPVTDRPRQFDIRCVARNDMHAIKLAVECKALSKKFPLVIQRVPRTEKESFHDVLCAHEPEANSVGVTCMHEDTTILRTSGSSPLYPRGMHVGKSCNQIGYRNGKLFANDGEVYDKWAQAISSAHDLIDESSDDREKLGLDVSVTVVFPVLIVSDDCLWCVDYDYKGNRVSEPSKIDELFFYIGKEYWSSGQMHAGYTASHLHILTYSGYEHFTKKLASNQHYWDDVFPMNNLKEVE